MSQCKSLGQRVGKENLCLFEAKQAKTPKDEIFEGLAFAFGNWMAFPPLISKWKELRDAKPSNIAQLELLRVSQVSPIIIDATGNWNRLEESKENSRSILVYQDEKAIQRLIYYIDTNNQPQYVFESGLLPPLDQFFKVNNVEQLLPLTPSPSPPPFSNESQLSPEIVIAERGRSSSSVATQILSPTPSSVYSTPGIAMTQSPQPPSLRQQVVAQLTQLKDATAAELPQKMRNLSEATVQYLNEEKTPFNWTSSVAGFQLGIDQLQRLAEPNLWVDDLITNFAMEYERAKIQDARVGSISSLFLAGLLRNAENLEKALKSNRRSPKNGGFYDAVFIVRHFSGNHWVGYVMRADGTYLYFDSFQDTEPAWSPLFARVMNEYVGHKLLGLGARSFSWKSIQYKIPPQQDTCSCGIYLSAWWHHLITNYIWNTTINARSFTDESFIWRGSLQERATLILRWNRTV